MRTAIAVLLLLSASAAAAGTPSDAQVRKQMQSPGVIEVRLTSAPGTVQGNADILNHEFVRGVEVVRTTEFPGIRVVVIGDAVYQYAGGGKWNYWKFRVIENVYEGLPDPKPEEVQAILDKDKTRAFGGGLENVIVQVHTWPRPSADTKWKWDSLNSVSFTATAKIDLVASNTEIETVEQELTIRLLRDDMKAPWKGYIAAPTTRRSLGRSTVPQAELAHRPRLAQQVRDEAQAARNAKLPQVEVPEFASAGELVAFVHRTLREGPPEKVEAVFLALAAPNLRGPGGNVLNSLGTQMLQQALKIAYGGRLPYGKLYCGDSAVAPGQNGRFTIAAVVPKFASEILVVKAGGKMVDGVRTGDRFLIEDAKIRSQDDDQIVEYVNSFSDRRKLCPKDPM